jgi:restriction system protein
MIKRIAKKGANAGKTFYGCANFPKCRGIINVED